MGTARLIVLPVAVALGALLARGSPAQEVKRIAPGMTKAQVYQILGMPAVVWTVGDQTYYVYPTGCEKTCSGRDVVVFRGGRVTGAVLRAPGREYAAVRSSPPGPTPRPGVAGAVPVQEPSRVDQPAPNPPTAVERPGPVVMPTPSQIDPGDSASRDTTTRPLAANDPAMQPVEQQARPRAGSIVPEDAKRLVVQLIGHFGDGEAPEIGAGIIVGATSQNVYIATARHVVTRGVAEPRELRVVFPGEQHDSVRATPLPGERAGLDLAVVSVPLATARALKGGLPAFDRRGDVRSLRSGAPVSPVGCPQGVCWEAPAPPDRILGIDRQGIIFQTNFVAGGSSGGALFNEWWEVVGLVIEEQPPRGEAIGIDRVVEQVRYWGYPVDLRRTAVPRGGYRTSVGVSVLAPSPALNDRAPSGRLTLSSRAIPQVSWHAGLVRLAPENLAVTAGMAGLGLHLKKGRFALHPFVEAGFGRIQGRFVVDSYYVATAEGYRYVFNRVEDDGLGVGGGMTVEVTLVPRTIIELVTGYWSFTTPPNAPQLNDVFIGVGLRFGL